MRTKGYGADEARAHAAEALTFEIENYWQYELLVPHVELPGLYRYDATRQHARGIDDLSRQLLSAHEAGGWSTVRECILDSDALSRLLSANELPIDDPAAMPGTLQHLRVNLDEASIVDAIRRLSFHALMSVLARLDHEYAPALFPVVDHRPTFDLVTPCRNPNPDCKRNPLWMPTRRLIDFMACIGYANELFASESSEPPTFSQIADRVLSKGDKDDDVLKAWRSGRRALTSADAVRLWDLLLQQGSRGEKGVPPPMPLILAAVVFQAILVRFDDRGKLVLRFHDVTPYYRQWWQHHYDALGVGEQVTVLTPWPRCFYRP